MKTSAFLLFSTALLCVTACKPRDGGPSPAPGSGSAQVIASATRAPDDADHQDHVWVLAHHRPAKPTDPVRVRFHKFSVVQASFDPKTIEGGTATIELDLASLDSGSSERDDDLKSPAFIDVGKFATVTIEIANVQKQADRTFRADAAVALRGQTKRYPVTFEVLERGSDSIRVKGEHSFSRLDFGVGTDPAADPTQQVDTQLSIEVVLTLRNH